MQTVSKLLNSITILSEYPQDIKEINKSIEELRIEALKDTEQQEEVNELITRFKECRRWRKVAINRNKYILN